MNAIDRAMGDLLVALNVERAERGDTVTLTFSDEASERRFTFVYYSDSSDPFKTWRLCDDLIFMHST